MNYCHTQYVVYYHTHSKTIDKCGKNPHSADRKSTYHTKCGKNFHKILSVYMLISDLSLPRISKTTYPTPPPRYLQLSPPYSMPTTTLVSRRVKCIPASYTYKPLPLQDMSATYCFFPLFNHYFKTDVKIHNVNPHCQIN